MTDRIAELFTRTLHRHSKDRTDNEAFSPPIVNTSIYSLPAVPSGTYQYARWGNPTWTALEDALALLEGAPVVTFPSGMAAVAAVLCGLLKSGDRVLLPSDGYYTTRICADKYLVPMGIAVDTCPTAQVAARDLTGYRLVLVETPSNPGLDLADIAAVAQRAHAAGALLAVDNTTMTALGQRPLELGADLVISSDTKAVNGHSDLLFGHVAARDEAVLAPVRDWRKIVGAIPGSFEAWLVHRGLETLEVRFSRMCDSAQTIAERLAAHARVKAVAYPGLATHPAHALAQRQMLRMGCLIALELASEAAANAFLAACDFLRPATSFGSVHSSAERRARWGDAVPAGFIRLSVGCEPTEVLWGEIERALAASA